MFECWFGLIELIWQYCSGPERQYDEGKEISSSLLLSFSSLLSLYDCSHCKCSQCWKGALRKQPGFLRPPECIRREKTYTFIFSSSSPPCSGEMSRAACDQLTWERWMRWRESGGRQPRKRSRDDLPGERRMESFGLKDGGGGGAHLHLSKCGDYVKTPSACLKFHINSLTRSEKCASRHAHLSVAGCFQESAHSPSPQRRTFIFLRRKW